MFGDVTGVGALQGHLETTNELLAQVLAELKTMSGTHLAPMQASMALLTTQVAAVTTQVAQQPQNA